MSSPPLRPTYDLSRERGLAVEAAAHWGLQLEAPFHLSAVSHVAPAGDVVVKVSWGGDDESLHEADALRLWDGGGAVRLVDAFGNALLLERVRPGDDLSTVAEGDATAVAVEIAGRLWRPAQLPFRPVVPEVRRWVNNAEPNDLVPLARELLADLGPADEWVVHGDFHHHNVLRRADQWVAIDPKPYLADREYDVPPFLWNPLDNLLADREQVERRIQAFLALGLDERRIRAWTVIRGAYLRPELAAPITAIFAG